MQVQKFREDVKSAAYRIVKSAITAQSPQLKYLAEIYACHVIQDLLEKVGARDAEQFQWLLEKEIEKRG